MAATQQDLQELLRLQTARKIPIKDAMAQIKALQSANLRSIQQIADAPLTTVESAVEEAKAARSLQNACKAHLKRTPCTSSASATRKRPAAPAPRQHPSRKARCSTTDDDAFILGPAGMAPQQLEASLGLPLETDAERIAETTIETNRAPLVLAFAVELLRHSMPEQPLSSRLSLAQAVVSANSRSKAVAIGLDKGPSADEEGWAAGQPRIKVMGREIAVLKRGGYEWKADEEQQVDVSETGNGMSTPPGADGETTTTISPSPIATKPADTTWVSSPSISLKQSTFVARATSIADPAKYPILLNGLLKAHPSLESASHNVSAYRIHPSAASASHHIRERSHDDGETGAGDLLLRVMREANAVDTLVVMTRWYGGIMLGPDRWRLIRNVVTAALAERLRRTGTEAPLGGEAVWGLDLESMRSKSKASFAAGGLVIHRPEAARSYLLKSFATVATTASKGKKKTVKAQDTEKEENLSLVLGALRLLFDSWADFLTPEDLDRRAWTWYTAIRPEAENGPLGWGAKGIVGLKKILDLRRQPP